MRLVLKNAGFHMRIGYKTKALLTTLIVLTVTAIVIVGFVLAWDVFDLGGKLTALLDTDLYASEEPLTRSDTAVTVASPKTSGLPEAEALLIERYFICYFASLGSFYPENIARFYADACEDELIDEMTLRYEISAARTAPADCSFRECAVRYTVLSRRSTGRETPDTAELSVRVSAELPYGFSELPAQIIEELHTFRLTTAGKETLISAHTSDRPARRQAEAALETVLSAVGYTRKDLSYTYYAPYLAKASELLNERLSAYRESFPLAFSAQEPSVAFSAEYEYDRAAAVGFAREETHSAAYGNYEENDANFCSACLAEGGIPMDAQGDKLTQWKWYGYEENNAREHKGCTRSWYDRERFWIYGVENTGFGLSAAPAGYGEPGDVIQLMDEETPVLEAIITAVIYGADNVPADYLICTDRLKNVPLSLIRAGDYRILHIIGYNTANI